jgi:FixJ family two-component response regulator
MPGRPLVCIVDDDRVLRARVADLIHSGGYDTAQFATANTFLASEEKRSCRCVVTDMQMPGLNGADLKDVTEVEGLKPPVTVTALSDTHRARWAARTGAGFLR